MTAYTTPPADAFATARDHFATMLDHLGGRDSRARDHSAIEAWLEAEGRTLLRHLFQGHLDVRAAAERPRTAVTGADDVARTHRRDSARALESVFGTVTVRRVAYGARGVARRHPLDAALNLPAERYSHGVRRSVACWAARLSFDEVVAELGTRTGAHVPKRQVEQLVVRAACDFDAFYATRRVVACDVAPDLVVLTFDGKGVPMRFEDLRPETQAAARRARRLRHRLRAGEKRHRKRMAQVAAVYGVARFVRAPEDVVRELRPDGEPLPVRPRPTAKRVWASVATAPADVIAAAFDEATRRDPRHRRRWVVLVDGNPTQLELVQAQAAGAGADVTIVLDLIHVLEYLWRAAYAFHAAGSADAEVWVASYLAELLAGKARYVAAAIRRSATRRGVTGAARAAVDDCADYLLTYQDYLRYDEYLCDGLPIATGVIEGACRYLVKDRMERTGARWRLTGAEAVLRLRALHASGDFDAYWAFHLAKEFERTHASRYGDGEVQRAAA